MILMINKWHKVNGIEVSTSTKVEKPTDIECYREAQKQLFKMASDYSADTSVTDWTLCIYNPKTMKVEHPECYFTPDAPVEEEPAE